MTEPECRHQCAVGERCTQPVVVKPDGEKGEWCYYHSKVARGLFR